MIDVSLDIFSIAIFAYFSIGATDIVRMIILYSVHICNIPIYYNALHIKVEGNVQSSRILGVVVVGITA